MPHFLKKKPNSLWIRLVFWGRKWPFLRGISIFLQKKNCHFRPQKRGEFDEKSGYFWENVVFSSSGDCNSPFGAATLGILVSSYRRITSLDFDKCHIFSQKSQYLVKFDSFFGVEIGNLSLFLGTPAGPWDDLPTRVWQRALPWFHLWFPAAAGAVGLLIFD